MNFKNLVKYTYGYYSAVVKYTDNGIYNILYNFTQPNIVLGCGKTEENA